MYAHSRFVITVLCALVLMALFAPVASLYAQDELPVTLPPDVPTGAATELTGSGMVTLDEEVQVDAATVAKTAVQETERLIDDTGQAAAVENKMAVYLPIVGKPGKSTVITINPTPQWRNIKAETFEGVFPNGLWRSYDSNRGANGEYYWDDDDYKPYSGRWSAWAANGGANARDPEYYYYANNMYSWMTYGPFSLESAQNARVFFRYWNRSEAGYDRFWWTYSCDGVSYQGNFTSGDSLGWQYKYLYIPCLRDSTVWIGFFFHSDGRNVSDGPFVDDVYIQEYR
jgi:hypothetical protein